MATRTIEEMKAELATLGGGMQNLERISQIAYEMDAYVRSGNVAASELEAAKAFALSDLGKRRIERERRSPRRRHSLPRHWQGRYEAETGKAHGRHDWRHITTHTTADGLPLLSSASAAPSTLLG